NIPITINPLLNDSDPDNDTLTIVALSGPGGTISSLTSSNFVFTPTNATPASDVLNYTISDGFGGSNSATITIDVTNRPPTAVNDSSSTARNVPITINPLLNDSDPDNDTLAIVALSGPGGTISSLTSSNFVFTPTNATPASDVLNYTISDGFGGSNSATITINVTNRPPTAVNDTA